MSKLSTTAIDLGIWKLVIERKLSGDRSLSIVKWPHEESFGVFLEDEEGEEVGQVTFNSLDEAIAYAPLFVELVDELEENAGRAIHAYFTGSVVGDILTVKLEVLAGDAVETSVSRSMSSAVSSGPRP